MRINRLQRPAAGAGLIGAVALVVLIAILRVSAAGEDHAQAQPWDDFVASTAVSGGTAADAGKPGAATTPLAPAPELLSPAELLREGEFERAASAFAAEAARATDPSLAAEALVGSAAASWNAGGQEEAVTILEQAVATAPVGSPWRRLSSLALALRLDALERTSDGRALLEPLLCPCEATDALQPYIDAAFATAAAASGDLSAARVEWDRLASDPALPDDLAARIYKERSEAERKAGNAAEYRRWQARLVAQTDDPADRLALAGAMLAAGDSAGAAKEWRTIVAGAPSSSAAVASVTALHLLELPVDAGQEGLVAYRHGDYVAAIAVLGRGVDEVGITAEGRAFRLFYLAASYEDSGQAALAITTYDLVTAAAPGSGFSHRARYWAARVAEANGQEAEASRRYVELVRDGPRGEFTAESGFRGGYTLLRNGDAAGALAAWDAIVGASATADARVLYWRGRALKLAGRPTDAAAAFQLAVTAGPNTFYGLEAAIELGTRRAVDVRYRPRTVKGVDWVVLEQFFAGVDSSPATPAPEAPAAFVAIGMSDEAEALLVRGTANLSIGSLLARAEEADRLRLTSAAARLGVVLAGRLPAGTTPPPDLLRLQYPVDFGSLVESTARNNGIDPLFLAALVRQESFWDPMAGSHAGALGLTQVIPETGAAIARALGRPFNVDDLFRPAVSLLFGANYIAGQLRAYGSDPYRALAAYNAGPGNASEWSAAAAAGTAGFLEAVDIPETHDYIQKVMEHYAIYSALYGG